MKTLQSFIAGKVYHYEGSYPDYNVKDGDAVRPATPEEARDIRIEELANGYIEQNIYCNDTSLVDDLIEQQGGIGGLCGFSDDDIENLSPDSGEWSIEECREWLDDRDISYIKPPMELVPSEEDVTAHVASMIEGMGEDDTLTLVLGVDEDGWTLDEDATSCSMEGTVDVEYGDDARSVAINLIEELKASVEYEFDEDTYLEELQELVRDNADPAEVYEWWRVSDWMCRQLRTIGEVVLDNGYGCWWGRQATGQVVIMDGTFQKLAAQYVDAIGV